MEHLTWQKVMFQSVLLMFILENTISKFENNCQTHDVTIIRHLLVSRVVRTSSEIQCTFSHRKT